MEAVAGYIFIVLGPIAAIAAILCAIVAFISITHRDRDGIECVVLSPFCAFMAWWLISTGLTWIH